MANLSEDEPSLFGVGSKGVVGVSYVVECSESNANAHLKPAGGKWCCWNRGYRVKQMEKLKR